MHFWRKDRYQSASFTSIYKHKVQTGLLMTFVSNKANTIMYGRVELKRGTTVKVDGSTMRVFFKRILIFTKTNIQIQKYKYTNIYIVVLF